MSNILPENVIIEALGGDDEIKNMIRELAKTAIRQSAHLITNGNEATQINAIRNLMPAIVKALTVNSNAEHEAVAAIKKMLEEARPVQPIIFPNLQIPVDKR